MKKLQEIISLIKLAFDKNDYVKKVLTKKIYYDIIKV